MHFDRHGVFFVGVSIGSFLKQMAELRGRVEKRQKKLVVTPFSFFFFLFLFLKKKVKYWDDRYSTYIVSALNNI